MSSYIIIFQVIIWINLKIASILLLWRPSWYSQCKGIQANYCEFFLEKDAEKIKKASSMLFYANIHDFSFEKIVKLNYLTHQSKNITKIITNFKK